MRTYRWLPMTVKKYNSLLAEHGGTFLVSKDSRYLEVWDVSPIPSEDGEFVDGFCALVTFYPASYSASEVYADQRTEATRPDHEEYMSSIDDMWGIASHFMRGY